MDELEAEAMVIDGVVVAALWRRWCFPSLRANPRSERDVGGVWLRTVNLVSCAGRPPTLYIALRQGPTDN